MQSCVNISEDFKPESKLQITVFNDTNEKISGSIIYIYDTKTEYQTAVKTKDYSRATVSATSSLQGEVEIVLKPNTKYYILASYFDSNRSIKLTNIGLSEIINNLPIYTTIFLEMKLKPETANVLFYSNSNTAIPIDIQIIDLSTNIKQEYILDKSYVQSTIPTLNSDNTLRISQDAGNYTYYAKNKNGCVWTGNYTNTPGKIAFINLPKCNSGVVSFFTSIDNLDFLPLTVKINNIQNTGLINNTLESMNCTSDKANAYTEILDKGLYTYLATSADGKCAWTGRFTIKGEDCLIIPLTKCTP